MTKIKCSLTVIAICLFTTALKSQGLVNISIAPELKLRVEAAIKKANSYPVPSWCNTADLQQQRKIVIEKCVKTLFHNYLPPHGKIKYEGVVPSPTTFNGLWSWDSWKHAAALASIDKDLAENSIRAMYAFQLSDGMIPDCIFRDTMNFTKSTAVTTLTKPPLSGWAIWEIYNETKDVGFVKEMFPLLLKYHEWRYLCRDINKNGLCEVGANVNNVQSAKYEMWDDAIRFDGVKLLKKSDSCYSMNIESVDLNAYLYLEKDIIIKMANLIGKKEIAKRFEKEKIILGQKIQETFFDNKTGCFYDVYIDDKSFILSKEANCWIPLFARVATKEEAERIRNQMMDENIFNTFVPLPTASKDNPKFYTGSKYWRGPVWLDQFYFGYIGLINYGYKKEAEALLLKLLKNGKDIVDPAVGLREYYNPLTGEPGGALNFGWTASHILMLMLAK
jgi:putative isomerase